MVKYWPFFSILFASVYARYCLATGAGGTLFNMKCRKCGRSSGLLRRKCPACKIPFIRLYLLVVIVLLLITLGGLVVAGKLP